MLLLTNVNTRGFDHEHSPFEDLGGALDHHGVVLFHVEQLASVHGDGLAVIIDEPHHGEQFRILFRMRGTECTFLTRGMYVTFFGMLGDGLRIGEKENREIGRKRKFRLRFFPGIGEPTHLADHGNFLRFRGIFVVMMRMIMVMPFVIVVGVFFPCGMVLIRMLVMLFALFVGMLLGRVIVFFFGVPQQDFTHFVHRLHPVGLGGEREFVFVLCDQCRVDGRFRATNLARQRHYQG